MSKDKLREEIMAKLIRLDGVNDIWRIFLKPDLLKAIIHELSQPWRNKGITKVAGVESRGFLFAPPWPQN